MFRTVPLSIITVYYCNKLKITDDPNADGTLLYEQTNEFFTHKFLFTVHF